MELREVLGDLTAEIDGDATAQVGSLAYDSRKVEPGTLFFCVPGARADGHDFAPRAVADGAAALVVERKLDLDVTQAVVADARAAMAPAARAFFGDPTSELRVVGITGTNGKTTSAFLVRDLLEAGGIQTGLLGTVKSVVGGVEAEVERTTPEAIDLQDTFRAMLDAGDRACAMEVSSHALSLGRAAGITFAAAAFTNLTQDHLDFHADMEEYFLAKRELFVGPSAGAQTALVNIDDLYGRRLADELAGDYGDRLVTLSAEGDSQAAVRASAVSFDAAGSRFQVAGPFGEVSVRTPLPGRFNVANALGALAAAVELGVEPATAAAALADAAMVPGRVEPVDEGQRYAVLVDYAHTPDSLDNVLRAAREMTGSGRLICVFGAGGDRDRDKRPLMGAIAARLSDIPVLTSDNPRSEDPDAILEDILGGIPGGREHPGLIVEVDRRKAIARALETAEPGDTVVIAGKGHEQGQEFEGGRKIPFDDRDVAREELRRLAGAGVS